MRKFDEIKSDCLIPNHHPSTHHRLLYFKENPLVSWIFISKRQYDIERFNLYEDENKRKKIIATEYSTWMDDWLVG